MGGCREGVVSKEAQGGESSSYLRLVILETENWASRNRLKVTQAVLLSNAKMTARPPNELKKKLHRAALADPKRAGLCIMRAIMRRLPWFSRR